MDEHTDDLVAYAEHFALLLLPQAPFMTIRDEYYHRSHQLQQLLSRNGKERDRHEFFSYVVRRVLKLRRAERAAARVALYGALCKRARNRDVARLLCVFFQRAQLEDNTEEEWLLRTRMVRVFGNARTSVFAAN